MSQRSSAVVAGAVCTAVVSWALISTAVLSRLGLSGGAAPVASNNMASAPSPVLHRFSSTGALSTGLAEFVCQHATTAIAERGQFVVALSGGSLPALAADGLLASQSDWAKWFVVFADERVVPLDHVDSNYKTVHEAFLNKVCICSSRVSN